MPVLCRRARVSVWVESRHAIPKFQLAIPIGTRNWNLGTKLGVCPLNNTSDIPEIPIQNIALHIDRLCSNCALHNWNRASPCFIRKKPGYPQQNSKIPIGIVRGGREKHVFVRASSQVQNSPTQKTLSQVRPLFGISGILEFLLLLLL
jgi:hypothetical protein